MNYHWISDQAKLQNCYVYWDKGVNNKADYVTKHHPPNYHRKIRPAYILKGYNMQQNNVTSLPARVCCSYGTEPEQFRAQTNLATYLNSRCQSRLLNDNGQL